MSHLRVLQAYPQGDKRWIVYVAPSGLIAVEEQERPRREGGWQRANCVYLHLAAARALRDFLVSALPPTQEKP